MAEPTNQGHNEKLEPRLRTMKSDAEVYLQESKESPASIVARSAVASEGEEHPSRFSLFFQKNKRTIFFSGIGIIVILLIGAAFSLLYKKTAETPRVTPQEIIPPAFFSMEKTRNITVKQDNFGDFKQNLGLIQNEGERIGILKRVVLLVKKGDTDRLGTLREFFAADGIDPSDSLAENFETSFNFFLYYQKTGVRKGLIIPIASEAKVFRTLIDQEGLLRNAWGGLYDSVDPKGSIAAFEDITYRNIDIRRLQLSEKDDLGFYYSIFKPKKYLVITTSYEAMRTALDRIFDSL